MKIRLTISIILLTGIFHIACDPNVDILGQENIDSYTSVYMPQAEGGAKSETLNISDDPQELLFGAAYGGMNYPSRDIEVTFKVDDASAEAYNSANGTTYTILPPEAYSMTETKAIIPSGKTSSAVLKLLVNTKAMAPFVRYIIAVKIEQAGDNEKINEALQTAYFILKTQPNREDYPNLDRGSWSVTDKSSEEPTEGNWGNGGLVMNTFDDVESTFWHTQWNGGTPPPPHWFIIDMGATRVLHGLSFLGRQSGNTNGRFKDVVVETSLDGSAWTVAGSFTLQDQGDEQYEFLSSGFNKEARYFKVTVNTVYEGVAYSHLAELNAF